MIASNNDMYYFAAIIVLLYAVSNVGGNYQHGRREIFQMGIPLKTSIISGNIGDISLRTHCDSRYKLS